MTAKRVTARIDRFAGLSDRDDPLQLTRIESPDLRNVEFSNRIMERRAGFRRVHGQTTMLRDCSARFDGDNDFISILDQPDFDFASRGYVSIVAVMREYPTSEVTILGRGSGISIGRFFQLSYDPASGSNGAWRLRVFDAGVLLRDITVDDGNASDTVPVDQFRFIEFYSTAGDTGYTLSVLDGNGADIGSATTTVAGFVSSSARWFIGADAASTGNANFTLAEFRLFNGAAKPSFQGAYNRELTDAEAATCVGYWKLNDGNGSTVADSSGNAFTGVIGAEGPEWVTDPDVVVGRTGLEFFGDSGFIQTTWSAAPQRVFSLYDTTSQAFTTGGTPVRSWTFAFVYTPRLGPGETAVRDQTIFWAGTSADDDPTAQDPSPLGVRVENDDIIVYYRDAASGTQTTAVGLTLSDNQDTRHRVTVNLGRNSGGTELVTPWCKIEGVTNVVAGSPITTDGGSDLDPASVAASWSFGTQITDFDYPPTENSNDAHLFGVLSDVAFFRSYDSNTNAIASVITLYDPFDQWSRRTTPVGPLPTQSGAQATFNLIYGLPLEDGYGNVLEVTGQVTTLVVKADSYLYPEEEDGVRWDIGLVDPYQSVEGQMLYAYDRIGPQGSVSRSMLAICGTTLYEIDLVAASATPVAGNLHKGGKWTVAQYGSTVYMASNNGKRPRKWSGGLIDWVGIRAPFQVPVVTTKTSGGSLADGTYYIKVTYRNGVTGAESDPSPSGSAVISGGSGSGAIDSLKIPISSDPQVTQRRIWISTDDSNFFLATTAAGDDAIVEGNTATTYTVDIGSISTTGLSLTGNEEPPPGSIVKVFKDRLFVAGWATNPTRVYWSQPGALDAFNQATDFVDTDLDSGDPISALETLRDSLIAHYRDGRVRITASGDSTDPFFLTFLSKDSGAVGPLAVLEFDSAHIYVGERDIVLWDGSTTFNASSPQDPERPSIQTFVRDTINPARRGDISVALHRRRSQVWMALSTTGNTRNDTILVFDYSQGVWSRYRMDLDVVAEIEDENDDPQMFGISRGHVVKLDTGDFDGHSDAVTVAAGLATGDHSTTTLQDTGRTWTVDAYKGLYCIWYDKSLGSLNYALIASNTANTLTFYETQAASPATNDPYGIGAVEFYADFNLNFGNPFSLVRMHWAHLRGTSDNASNIVRIAAEPNVSARTQPFGSSTYNAESTWATTETHVLLAVGGLGRNWRVRVGDTGLAALTGASFPPSIFGRVKIQQMLFDGMEVDAR
jgi:hypothetical protein